MEDVIDQYQKWKQQGDGLRAKAKQAMETRFADLLLEALAVARDYQADFGVALKPPAQVTAFRYKVVAKGKPKKGKPASKVVVAATPKVDEAKVAALQKKLAGARKKLETAKAAGQATKNLEDKVYEIEDDLRLAEQAG